jgi:transcriptional regulator GlxA family with amidase domain
MPNKKHGLAVAVMALPDVTASTLYGVYDLFSSVSRDWGLLIDGVPGESRIKSTIVAAESRPFAVANGLVIQPEASFQDCQQPDVVCIPDVLVPPGARLGETYDRERRWVRECLESGSTIATACSGALLLAEEGLLDGLEATTHWAYCDAFKRDYPSVRLHPNRALVATGQGQRIVMAGGGTSWQDLVLYLIARFVGVEEAMQVAKLYLINWHNIGQQPFAALARTLKSDDLVIAKCQEWVAQNYEFQSPVSAMAELSGLAERSFNRRFAKATGMTPLEYVHTLRLEEAKHLLERTQTPIEGIAMEVGYEDASFFSRLFRRKVALTPAQYRRRFGALRETLEAGVLEN